MDFQSSIYIGAIVHSGLKCLLFIEFKGINETIQNHAWFILRTIAGFELF